MAPAGLWELAFCFGVGTYFSRVSAIFFWGVFFAFLVVFFAFLVVILRFLGDFAFWGVFSRYATIISRAARKKIAFFFRGAVSKT